MTRRAYQRLLGALLLVLAALGYQPDAHAQAGSGSPTRRYQIIDLGTAGGFFSRARAINNRGEIAGESLSPDNGDVRAVYWYGGTIRTFTQYNPATFGSSSAKAINNRGVMVGFYDESQLNPNPPAQGFWYDAATSSLNFLPGANNAVDINDAGQIIAVGPNASYFIAGGTSFTNFSAHAINNRGEVALASQLGAGSALYRQGQIFPIPDLGFGAVDLNDYHEIVGHVVVNLGIFGTRSRVRLMKHDGNATPTFSTVLTYAPFALQGSARATAINNRGEIVGIETRAVSGVQVKTPFFIENNVVRRLSDLLPPNSGWTLEGDFAEANGINDRGEIVGTGLINGEWHAFLMTPELCTSRDDVDLSGNPDNDGDGLCDSWEVNGIDVNHDGDIDFTFPGDMGFETDLNHKDMLVEYDWMDCLAGETSDCGGDAHDHKPVNPSGLRTPFKDSGLLNPDGSQGVTLRLIESEPVPHLNATLFLDEGAGVLDDFNDIKHGDRDVPCDGFLATAAIRGHADCEKKLKAWAMSVRYGIFGHDQPGDLSRSSGVGELPGNDFMVTLGGWGAGGIASVGGRQQAENATLLHELGHTLGLQHGGGDGVNCKPNYISVMSYALQFNNIHSERRLDYSSTLLNQLDELRLADGPIPNAEGILLSMTTVFGLGGAQFLVDIADPIDWKLDGIDPPSTEFSEDINWIADVCDADSIDAAQAGDPARNGGRLAVLRGFADWANIQIPFRLTADFVDGAHRLTPSRVPEITSEQALAAAQRVDYDEDGVTNYPDNCPAVANATQADADADGVGDACDSGPAADATPPVLTLPSNITMEATGPGGAAVNFAASANDLVDGTVPAVCTPASESTFPLGTTTVNCVATDASSNIARGSFDVIVRDTTPPALILSGPNPLSLDCHAPFVEPGVVAFDLVAGNLTNAIEVTGSVNSNLAGVYTLTYVVTDGANSTAATRTIEVRDLSAPTISALTTSANVLWPANHKMVPVSVAAAVSDHCDSNPVCEIVSVTSNEPVNGTGDGDTAPDWVVTGKLTVELRAERAGNGSGRVYTITVRCRDAAGNASTRTVTVVVPHHKY